jgi:hypothetical protein
MTRSVFFVASILLVHPASAKAADLFPWEVNPRIVTVEKSLYRNSPAAGTSAGVIVEYVGPNLELMESRYDASSPTFRNWESRRSTDNGKTWSEFQPYNPNTTKVTYGTGTATVTGNEYFVGPRCYDPQSGLLVDTYQQDLGGVGHPFWRTSADHGLTWSAPRMLQYEQGPQFDPNSPLNAAYTSTNLGWATNNIVKLSNGTILTAIGDANPVPRSSRCFIGRWDPNASDYGWTAGNQVSGPTSMLSEPMVAELKDNRVLVVYRGGTGCRKWFSTSTDGGMNLSSPVELKYDDGSQFYSPSSNCQLIRNSQTDKLYWIGNIIKVPDPSSINLPRYPLVIAEVDESGTIPALKKGTVTLIDGKQDGQPDAIQFTNFLVFEDRETHGFVLHMSLYGEHTDKWAANNYRYALTLTELPEPSSLALLGAGAIALAAWAVVRRGNK